jgi:hypothetical protein
MGHVGQMQRGVLPGSFAPRLEQGYRNGGFLYPNKPTTVFSKRDPCAINLTRPCITPQLSDEFMDLRESGCANRVSA